MLDDTQEKIIKATMELVMEKGYSNTTTKDIARSAGSMNVRFSANSRVRRKSFWQRWKSRSGIRI